MKVQVVDFHGVIKWLVTAQMIFIDPIYLDELHESIFIGKQLENNLCKYLN